DLIGKKRGALISGGQIDYNRIAVILLDEFRGGKIGNISLERPIEEESEEESNEDN
ncbi:MAG: ribosome biogenesis GTPase YlqF, partial [Clostridium butyricum]|nr:ribosome biogenesis GTPase YlqF [Clostridium butyricum]